MTGLTRLRLWVLLVAAATAPPLAAAGAGWLPLVPYPGWSGLGQDVGLPDEAFVAVRTQKGWVELLHQLGWYSAPRSDGSNHPPDIDFEKFTMLVAALGTRPSGGYSVFIQGAFDFREAIEVYVVEVRPGPDCTVTTAMTHPIAIALIPRSDRPVRFHIDTSDVTCKAARTVAEGRSSNNLYGVPRQDLRHD